MPSRKSIIVASLLACIAAACFFDDYSVTQYSCLECRATLTKRRIFSIPVQHIANDSYSASVVTQDPGHQHQWRWCGWEHSWSLVSITLSCGRQHPIWRLPVSVQARYSRLVPASELRAALQVIDSTDRETAETAVNQIYERVLDSQ